MSVSSSIEPRAPATIAKHFYLSMIVGYTPFVAGYWGARISIMPLAMFLEPNEDRGSHQHRELRLLKERFICQKIG